MWKKASVVAMLVSLSAASLLVARDDPANPCYKKKWFNSTINCTGSCNNYDVCPGRQLCAIAPAGGYAWEMSPLSPGIVVACDNYIGGTGSCPGGCTGGTPSYGGGALVTVPGNAFCGTQCNGGPGGGHD